MREPHKLPHETIHRSLSEANLRTERQFSHCGPVSNVADASATTTVHAPVREIEITVVEDVEELELQLRFRPLRNGEVLEQG